MKKFSLFGLMLVAACAFAAFASASAFAAFETAKYLANGVAVNAALADESTGGLELEDTENGASVLCEGSLDGSVEANGASTVTEVLVAGVKIPELDEAAAAGGVKCTSVKVCEAGDAEAYPFGLPFKFIADLETVAGTFELLVINAGYFIKCLVLGITFTELCEAAGNGLSGGKIANLATDIEAKGSVTPNGTCNGKENIGKITADEGNLTFLTNGEALQVSE